MKSKEYWDNQYTQKETDFTVLGNEKPSNAAVRLIEYFRENRILISGPLIEVGCGAGRNTNFFASQGFRALGVDISEVALNVARERAARDNWWLVIKPLMFPNHGPSSPNRSH